MHIYDDYIKEAGVDMEQIRPRVQVKFRDKLCFKGMRVDYDKFSQFVVRDNKWLPLFTVTDITSKDRVVDLYPLLCVGMAELISFSSNIGDNLVMRFSETLLRKEKIFESEIDLFNFTSFVENVDYLENEEELEILFSLRSDFVSCSFNYIKQLVSIMACCNFENKRLFCEALLESMKFTYSICSIYTTDLSKLSKYKVSCSSYETFDINHVTSNSSLKLRKIGYTMPSSIKKHYITNCRGLGIYSYLILLFSVYGKFGEFLSSYTADINLNDKDTLDYLQKQFNNCIGDDFVGRYYKTGNKKVRQCSGETAFPTFLQGVVPVNSGTVYTLDNGKKVTRDVYENELLWKRAHHVVFSKVDGVYIRNAETNYSKVAELQGVAYQCYSGNYDFANNNTISLSININDINAALEKEITSQKTVESDVDRIRKGYEEEILRLSDENKKRCNNYEKQIESLNAIIGSKLNIIEKLSSELKESRDYLRDYYSDEDISYDESSSISIEDMISYINQFKITMIGGRLDLIQKLNDRGVTGVVQVSSENMLNGTPINSDFFCMNTKFISHKVAHRVESRYRDQKSQMFYFNGTNIDSLIKACYDFIINWVGD